MTWDYLTIAREYAPVAAVDKGSAQEYINGEILDESEPSKNTEVTNYYENLYVTVDVL